MDINITLVIQGLAFFAVAWVVMKFGWLSHSSRASWYSPSSSSASSSSTTSGETSFSAFRLTNISMTMAIVHTDVAAITQPTQPP